MAFSKIPALVAVAALTVGACTKGPDKIEATYVSPSTFDGRSCSKLMSERNAIVSRLNSLTEQQQSAARTDAVATGVALVLFWPAAFALGATKDNATALSSAKGNYDAITTKMQQQGCAVPEATETS